MAESRLKKSLLNAKVNLIFYVLTLALSFFSRKIFIDCLGADFIGLSGTLQNLLGFLNLAELGVGTAIGYVLYKPLFQQDQGKINEIISVFGYLYRWIGITILAAGCLLAAFLPQIYPDTGFEYGIIYFAYFSFLASALIGYFINYRQNLLAADQRSYVVTTYFQTAIILKTLIQMYSAWKTGSYFLWITIELIFGIIHSILLNWKINQVYPWLKASAKLGHRVFCRYPEVMQYTRRIFVHQIAGVAQSQLTPFLTYTYASLSMVTIYGNYVLLSSQLQRLVSKLLGSTEAGVGNLVAQGNREHTLRIYWELISIRYFIGGIMAFGLYHLSSPFISIWLGSEYVLDNGILAAVVAASFIILTRGVNDQFIYAHGLFHDLWAPVTELVLQVGGTVGLGAVYGIHGVVYGSMSGLLTIVLFWKPYFLFSQGFRNKVSAYWLRIIVLIAIIAASWATADCAVSLLGWQNAPAGGYAGWIYLAVFQTGSYTVFALLFFTLFSPAFRACASKIVHALLP